MPQDSCLFVMETTICNECAKFDQIQRISTLLYTILFPFRAKKFAEIDFAKQIFKTSLTKM